MPYNCYEFVKETLNSILSAYYIVYDRDEQRNKFDINKNENNIFKSDIENIQKNKIINKEDNINDRKNWK